MRITNSMLTAQTLRDLEANYTAMAKAQEQVSSARRLNRPSDSPADVQQAIKVNESIASIAQNQRNAQMAQRVVSASETALASAGDAVQRLRELAIQAANDTLSPTDRRAILGEVQQLSEQLVSLANSKNGDDYLFSGQKTTTPAYANATAAYAGDTGAINARIAPGVSLPINVTADTAFGPALAAAAQLATDLAGGTAPQQTTIAALDSGFNAVVTARTRIGAIDKRLSNAEAFLADTRQSAAALLSQLQDADMAEAISQAASRQTTYQAAIAVSARMLQKSLIDEL